MLYSDLTRDKIKQQYDIDENNTIRSPGKFEGEIIYVPYFWQQVLDGIISDCEYDENDNVIWSTYVEDDERIEFPELSDVSIIRIWEDEQGFIHAEVELED